MGGAAIPAPVSLLFLPDATGRFVTFHPTLAARPTLEFGTAADGSPEMRVRLGEAQAVAGRAARN